jgi:glycolate oxidase FAD binding subunit
MSSDLKMQTVSIDDMFVQDVVEPETVEELCGVLAEATRAGSKLLVTGGGTRLAFGNLAEGFDAALSTRRLNHVLHYEPDDMMLAVEPGCTIAQIEQLLGEQGQFLALDVAHPDRATIGGSYSTGLSSPRRLAGGSLKDWVVGVEVAGPDGVVARAGGMVVKNVTGFDMMHLHYGALGAFGVVTRLNVKVFPRMSASRGVTFVFDSLAGAYRAGVALLRSQLQPTSLLISNGTDWTLDVCCDAPVSAIGRVVERTIEVVANAAEPLRHDVHDEARRPVASFVRSVDLRSQTGVARLAVATSRQQEVLQKLEQVDEQRICADLGSGLIYVGAAPSEAWVTGIQRVTAQTTFLALPAELKRELDVFGLVDPHTGDIVRRLKQAFDPARTLNAGRFALRL